MTQTTRFFDSEEIRPLARRSDVMGALLVAHCWACIFGAMALVVWAPNPLTVILAIMIIGSRQLGLAILMHDAAHNALFKTRWLNEFAGTWLCGRPILADLAAYRHYHLKHHRFTQTDEDPDLVLSKPFPTTRASLTRKLIRDITGQTGIKQRAQQIAFEFQMAGDVDKDDPAYEQLSQNFSGPNFTKALALNLGFLVFLAALGVWWLYPLFWIVPLLTWYQLVLRVRNIAEHGAVEFSDNPLRNVRTTRAGPLTAFFLAPYWVNYHLEHHLVMHVPCWNLPKLHALMLDKGYGDRMEIGASYWDVLKTASSKPA